MVRYYCSIRGIRCSYGFVSLVVALALNYLLGGYLEFLSGVVLVEFMSRKKDRIDYKEYHRTGRKVLLVPGGKNIKMDKDEICELQINADIEHALSIYGLEDLVSVDEINEALHEISELCQTFRHIHVEMQNKLGDDYKVRYPKYNETVEKLMLFTKSAKKKLRTLKQEEKEDKNASEKGKEKEALAVEGDFLALKVKQLLAMVDISISENVSEIDTFISKMEAYLNDYYSLSVKLKCCYGEDYSGLYDVSFQKDTRIMNDEIKMANLSKKKLLENDEQSKMETVEKDKQLKHVIEAQNLISEIEFRCDSLENKFDRKLEDLSDYQILEISQNKNLDLEFNGVLEKVTSLAALAPNGGEGAQQLLRKAIQIRDGLAKSKKAFLKSLQKIVSDRDITPDKMKNASSLKIELPKFSGYESKIDFYTFKSQFKKLIEPTVRKQYWADWLKHNYLSGPALILVEKETEYHKIWERLLESFGNSRLLLQNKLGTLDKIGGLWKIKGDSKIASALAGLINTMTDLSALATEHSIEGQLYEGGGLEKILFLIGDHRHKKFRSKNLSSSVTKKGEWEKLLQFLKDELQLREKLILDNKTAQLMGLCPNSDNQKVEMINQITAWRPMWQ